MGELNWKWVLFFPEIVLNLIRLQLSSYGGRWILTWILNFLDHLLLQIVFAWKRSHAADLRYEQYILSQCQPLLLFSQSLLSNPKLELKLLFGHVKHCLITLDASCVAFFSFLAMRPHVPSPWLMRVRVLR